MSKFLGWAIDRDYLTQGEGNRIGIGQTEGDAGGFYRVTITKDLKASDVINPVRFRTLDDDGEVYYGGSISAEWINGAEEFAFGPLAYAQADAGATELQYKRDGVWVTL